METDTTITSDDMSRHDATSRDSEQYTVSVTEAAELFTISGLPRTERAIQRFCKKGDLICAFQDTAYGSRYLIKRSSIDRLIQQKLQALAVTPDTDGRDVSRQDATGRDVSRHEVDEPVVTEVPVAEPLNRNPIERHDTEERHVATGRDDEEFKKLREENLGLKIDNSARQQFINHLTTELEKSHNQVQELSYNLGVAHTRVAQLEAPRSNPEPRDTPSDDMSRPVTTTATETIITSVVEQKGTEGNLDQVDQTPAEAITPGTPKPSFWRTIFR